MNVFCPHCSAMLGSIALVSEQVLVCPNCNGRFIVSTPALPQVSPPFVRTGQMASDDVSLNRRRQSAANFLYYAIAGMLTLALCLITTLTLVLLNARANQSQPTSEIRTKPLVALEPPPKPSEHTIRRDATREFWMEFRSMGEQLLSLDFDPSNTPASAMNNFDGLAKKFRSVADQIEAKLQSSLNVDVDLVRFAERQRDVCRSVSQIFSDLVELARNRETYGPVQSQSRLNEISARMHSLGSALEGAAAERELLRIRLASRYGIEFPETSPPVSSPPSVSDSPQAIATLRYWEEFRSGVDELNSKKLPGNAEGNLNHFNGALVGMGIGLQLQDRTNVDPELLKAADEFVAATTHLSPSVSPSDRLAQTSMYLATVKLGDFVRMRETLERRYGVAFPIIVPGVK